MSLNMSFTPQVSKYRRSISRAIRQVRLGPSVPFKGKLTVNIGGSVLSLDQILTTSLFYQERLPSHGDSDIVLSLNGSAFPMLSQGDHPVLGTPCWYLHPCETARAVDELQQNLGLMDGDDKERWLELWFMLVGNVVNLRGQ